MIWRILLGALIVAVSVVAYVQLLSDLVSPAPRDAPSVSHQESSRLHRDTPSLGILSLTRSDSQPQVLPALTNPLDGRGRVIIPTVFHARTPEDGSYDTGFRVSSGNHVRLSFIEDSTREGQFGTPRWSVNDGKVIDAEEPSWFVVRGRGTIVLYPVDSPSHETGRQVRIELIR